jgi:tRNA-guanine family transglycosylase
MFDCVWPTRTARFGNALTPAGPIALRQAKYASDFTPILETCTCPCCLPRDHSSGQGLGITKAFIHHVAAKETAGAHLLTMHNVHFLLQLMDQVRTSIIEDRFPAFLKNWLRVRFGGKESIPGWAVGALKGVGVDVLADE